MTTAQPLAALASAAGQYYQALLQANVPSELAYQLTLDWHGHYLGGKDLSLDYPAALGDVEDISKTHDQ